jgi:hypothetical protein
MSRLAKLNLIVFALLIAHTVDHAVNQPARDLPATGSVIGVAGFAILAASAVLALRRNPHAPAAAAFAGFATALGFVAVHLLPAWADPISDPYWDFGANTLSWVLLVAPLAAAVVLGAAGLRELGRPAPIPVAGR